jgi:hypothetical protein
MYQVVGVITWKTREAGNKGHKTLIPRALDRWEEISPPGAQAFVTRCSDTQTVFTTLFPSSEGVVGDLERQKFRRIAKAVIRDLMDRAEFVLLEGDVSESRTK